LVVGREILGPPRIAAHADRTAREIDVGISLVVGDEVGPAEVPRRARLVDLVVPHGTARTVAASVGTDLAPVQVARACIDRDAPGIAATHRVDLGPTVFGSGEEIAGRDL